MGCSFFRVEVNVRSRAQLPRVTIRQLSDEAVAAALLPYVKERVPTSAVRFRNDVAARPNVHRPRFQTNQTGQR